MAFLAMQCSSAAYAQKMIGKETDAQKHERLAWWTDARFGMFIHWGLYSEGARGEWLKHYQAATDQEYQKYFDHFNPDQFDAKKWAQAAKDAGMKYAVLTTKHHEGFCLFDSKFTAYKAPNTQAKRDLVKEYVDAFRAKGLKVGFYYSLLDWHHPQYTMDSIHPLTQRDRTKERYIQMNKGRDMAQYRQYMRNQITELLTKYGKIDVLWLDFSFPHDKDKTRGKTAEDWGSVELLKLIRKLQPGIIVDNRMNLEEYKDGADFETPEQVSPKELERYRGRTWETCQTFSGAWGYNRDESSWKTQRQLLDLLISSVANGGNLILNVGPTARGEFDYRATKALDSISYWMHANSQSIYKCTYAPSQFICPDGNRLTYNPSTKKLYLHLFNYPKDGVLKLEGYQGKVKYMQFLNDYSELLYKPSPTSNSDVIVDLPKNKPPYEVPVMELSL